MLTVRAATADVLHLHHLTPLDAAAARVAPRVPVVTHLHGTELLMLEAIDDGLGASWPHAGAWAERLRTWAARSSRARRRHARRPRPRPGRARRRSRPPRGRPQRRRRRPASLPRRSTVQPSGAACSRIARWAGGRGGAPGSWRAQPAAVRGARGRRDVPLRRAVHRGQARPAPDRGVHPRARRGWPAGSRSSSSAATPASGRASIRRTPSTGSAPTASCSPAGTTRRELPDLLRASDVVVLPSVNESFGQVLVEGMACELPPIAVDRGGPAEIVDDGDDRLARRPRRRRRTRTRDPRGRDRRRASAGGAARSPAATVLDRYTWRAATRELSAVLEAAALRARRRDAPRAERRLIRDSTLLGCDFPVWCADDARPTRPRSRPRRRRRTRRRVRRPARAPARSAGSHLPEHRARWSPSTATCTSPPTTAWSATNCGGRTARRRAPRWFRTSTLGTSSANGNPRQLRVVGNRMFLVATTRASGNAVFTIDPGGTPAGDLGAPAARRVAGDRRHAGGPGRR